MVGVQVRHRAGAHGSALRAMVLGDYAIVRGLKSISYVACRYIARYTLGVLSDGVVLGPYERLQELFDIAGFIANLLANLF
jgi:hypothetical protein